MRGVTCRMYNAVGVTLLCAYMTLAAYVLCVL